MDTKTVNHKSTSKIMSYVLGIKKTHIILLIIGVIAVAVASAGHFQDSSVTYSYGKSTITFDPYTDQYKKDYHVTDTGKFTILQPDEKEDSLLTGSYVEIIVNGKLEGYSLKYDNGLPGPTLSIADDQKGIVGPGGYEWGRV